MRWPYLVDRTLKFKNWLTPITVPLNLLKQVTSLAPKPKSESPAFWQFPDQISNEMKKGHVQFSILLCMCCFMLDLTLKSSPETPSKSCGSWVPLSLLKYSLKGALSTTHTHTQKEKQSSVNSNLKQEHFPLTFNTDMPTYLRVEHSWQKWSLHASHWRTHPWHTARSQNWQWWLPTTSRHVSHTANTHNQYKGGQLSYTQCTVS